jgi:LPS-assembly lipoprotein
VTLALTYIVASLLSLTLSSCGFHLRGDYKLPPQMANTYIKATDNNSQLIRVLKRLLKTSNINVVKVEQQAQAILNISDEKQEKRVLSVDTQGRAREYELNYQINFNVSTDKNNFLIEEQTIKLQRDFLFDTEDVLGKGREEDTLIKDMQQDMVRLIMSRLQAAAGK